MHYYIRTFLFTHIDIFSALKNISNNTSTGMDHYFCLLLYTCAWNSKHLKKDKYIIENWAKNLINFFEFVQTYVIPNYTHKFYTKLRIVYDDLYLQ